MLELTWRKSHNDEVKMESQKGLKKNPNFCYKQLLCCGWLLTCILCGWPVSWPWPMCAARLLLQWQHGRCQSCRRWWRSFSVSTLSLSLFSPLFFCNILKKCVCIRISVPDHGRDFSIVILLETIIKHGKCQTLLGTVLHPATGNVILLETVNVITVKLSWW